MKVDPETLGRMPPRELLETVAPYSLWEEAVAQAVRSPHKRHRTGAILFDQMKIIGRGCAHDSYGTAVRSIHAEIEAIKPRIWKPFAERPSCLIVTLTRVGNFASVSRPCTGCARALLNCEIKNVIFAERANDDSWAVRCEPPINLLNGKLTRYT